MAIFQLDFGPRGITKAQQVRAIADDGVRGVLIKSEVSNSTSLRRFEDVSSKTVQNSVIGIGTIMSLDKILSTNIIFEDFC